MRRSTAGRRYPHEVATPSVSDRRERRLLIAVALNVVIVAMQIGFGVVARSLGLIADAGHNLTDVAALAVSLIAVRWARRRPTPQRSFGYHRATILAALANAASILAITVFIVYEGVRRLLHPSEVRGGLVVIVALIAAAANLVGALAIRESHGGHDHGGHDHDDADYDHASDGDREKGGAGEDLNMRSAMLHLVGDSAASIGVAIAGVIILVTGRFFWIDPLVSMIIAVLLAVQAWKVVRAAADVLLESTPRGLSIEAVSSVISAVPGVEQMHDLHVWSLSSEVRALSAHVVLSGHPTLEEAQVVANAVKMAIGERFAIAHATLKLECESCAPEGDWCAIDEIGIVSVASRSGHFAVAGNE